MGTTRSYVAVRQLLASGEAGRGTTWVAPRGAAGDIDEWSERYLAEKIAVVLGARADHVRGDERANSGLSKSNRDTQSDGKRSACRAAAFVVRVEGLSETSRRSGLRGLPRARLRCPVRAQGSIRRCNDLPLRIRSEEDFEVRQTGSVEIALSRCGPGDLSPLVPAGVGEPNPREFTRSS